MSDESKQVNSLWLFADWILNDRCDDIDGGELQDALLKFGIIVPVEVTEPCDPEYCACAEFDPSGFPTTCYRTAPWMKRDAFFAATAAGGLAAEMKERHDDEMRHSLGID